MFEWNASKIGEALSINKINNFGDPLFQSSSNCYQILQELFCSWFFTIYYISHSFNKYCWDFQQICHIGNSCTLKSKTWKKEYALIQSTMTAGKRALNGYLYHHEGNLIGRRLWWKHLKSDSIAIFNLYANKHDSSFT